ncbi:MAG: peptidoglycan-binding protein [Clostridiales bacterium]|nr:peptidoglycan-binding protein [Clostridiales bacterium]
MEIMENPENIILRKGDTGAGVSELKRMLKALQYRAGEETDIFDGVTMHAVVAFQNDHGLPVSGAANGETWLALQAALHNKKSARPAPPERALQGKETRPSQETPADPGSDNSVLEDGSAGGSPALPPHMLKEGDSGDPVALLQEKLKRLGFFPGSVTGVFGHETKGALKAFQSKNALAGDGLAGPETLTALLDLTAAPQGAQTLPGGLKPVLRKGDSGEFVMLLQKELSAALHYDGPLNGVFDKKTLVAVKTFQDANRLAPDGVVGRATWFSLISIYPPED